MGIISLGGTIAFLIILIIVIANYLISYRECFTVKEKIKDLLLLSSLVILAWVLIVPLLNYLCAKL